VSWLGKKIRYGRHGIVVRQIQAYIQIQRLLHLDYGPECPYLRTESVLYIPTSRSSIQRRKKTCTSAAALTISIGRLPACPPARLGDSGSSSSSSSCWDFVYKISIRYLYKSKADVAWNSLSILLLLVILAVFLEAGVLVHILV